MQRDARMLGLRQQALSSLRMGDELARALPPELAAAVLPGRWADGSWTLHASSPAVAAKLKLHAPLLLRRLQLAGWPLERIQVRVIAPRDAPAVAPPPAAASRAPAQVRDRLRELRERREAARAGSPETRTG